MFDEAIFRFLLCCGYLLSLLYVYLELHGMKYHLLAENLKGFRIFNVKSRGTLNVRP